jgi:hypothetical protein
MQGSFSGIDWRTAFQPQLDEDTEEKYHEEDVKAILKATRNNQTNIQRPQKPYPPDIHFELKGKTFFILIGQSDAQNVGNVTARPGRIGKLLVPCIEVPSGTVTRFKPYNSIGGNGSCPPIRGDPGVSLFAYIKDDRPVLLDKYARRGYTHLSAERNWNFSNARFYEVGEDVLRQTLTQAETLDMKFARTIQGFANVNLSIVWDCIDPDFDPSDRSLLLGSFMDHYMAKFFNKQDPAGRSRPITAESIQRHKQFCQVCVSAHSSFAIASSSSSNPRVGMKNA